MGRRRRTLLGRSPSLPTPRGAPGKEDAAKPEKKVPTAIVEPQSVDEVKAPAVEEATAPFDAVPDEPATDAYTDDPTVEEAIEANYIPTGTMGADTTDDGWDRSVWSEKSDREVAYSQSTPDLPEAKEQTYPSPVGAPPTQPGAPSSEAGGYTPPLDAPIATDLYSSLGDFDGGPPPTEEVPSSVMEDIGTAYNAPMNVPEPPPIPGILDRFTPPPAERSGYSKPTRPAAAAGLPSYLDGVDEERPPTPPPVLKRKGPLAAAARGQEQTGGGPPILLIAGMLVGALALIVLVLGVAYMFVGQMGTTGTAEAPREDVPSAVEVRGDMTQKPGLIGVDKPEPAPEVVVEDRENPNVPVPGPGEPAPVPVPVPVVPVSRTAPKPNPRPASVAAPKPAATLGTLRVEANRRVLISVDGRVRGYQPQTIELPPGTYTVTAVLPAQADTEKKRVVTISAAGTTTKVDFAF